MKTYLDVAVIGGGPAGLQTARLLARSGADVAVFEKKPEIGLNVVCTGFVSREVFSEFNLPYETLGPEFQEARFVSSTGQTLHYRHPVPFAAVVDRRRFDRTLAKLAEEAGANVETGTTVRDVETTEDGVLLETVNGDRFIRRRARMAVLATGIDRRLQARLNLTAPKRSVQGAQAEIRLPGDPFPTIYAGPPTAPGGFAWAVPAGEGLRRIGLITDERPREAFAAFIGRHHPGLTFEGAARPLEFKPIYQGMARSTVADRVLSVGEAAGQVKTTTGGGIYFGLWGAGIAAEVIRTSLAADDLSASALAAYERRWKTALRREISLGLYVRKLYSWMSESQFEALFTLAQTDGLIPLLQREGNFDWQSGVLLSLFRKAAVADIFRAFARKPAFLDRLLN